MSKIPSETTREDINSSQRWAIGLIEGDGHIGLEWTDITRNKWVPILKVTLHAYNTRAIYKLKKCLGVGKISRSGSTISLRVRSRQLWLSHLIPLFDKFPFITSKYYDYAIVKKALTFPFRENREQLETPNEYRQLIESLKLQLNPKTKAYINKLSPVWKNVLDFEPSTFFDLAKAEERPFNINSLKLQLKAAFTGINRASLEKIIDKHWLAGFIEAEGSFYILSNGQHGFALGQTYDIFVVAAIHYLFDLKAQLKVRNNYVMLDTKNTESLFLISSIIDKKLLGIKSFIFSVWLRTLRKKNKAKSLKAKRIIDKLRSRTF
jgi:LAGLIDADG endonuclease